MILSNINHLRKNYIKNILVESDISSDPFDQFNRWWNHIKNHIYEPNAMILSTIGKDQQPCSRVVLLKEVKKEGFVFFTNYQSHKGVQIKANPFVSLLFYWQEFEQQIRIEGSIKKTSAKESDAYFAVRPLDSQIGTWASAQSNILKDRVELNEKFVYYKEKFAHNAKIPRPSHWGGYIVKPNLFEFWQGCPNRLHDRIIYQRQKNKWITKRLYP